MITIILILLSAIFKAVADTLQHHFDTSVFKYLTPKFWNPIESYKYVKFLPLTKYRPDAWHLSNSAMIICFICAVAVNDLYKHWNLPWWVYLLVLGAGFNIVFEIFYSKILRKK